MEAINIHQPVRAISNKSLWTGRIISGLCILFMLVDSIMKIILNHYSIEGTMELGWSLNSVQPLGYLLLIITILYIFPRTAILGALILTAYFGGAVATMARLGEPFYFPVIFCAMAWAGVYLRSKKLREFISSIN